MAEVKEEIGRAAIDRVLSGVAETQAEAGLLPGGPTAEHWAQSIVEQQIKKHEECEARGGIDGLRGLDNAEDSPAVPASRLDRGEIPDDAVVIRGTLSGPIDEMTPQARQHMLGPVPLPREDALMMARVKLLERFPEWHARICAAWLAGEQAAMRSGSELDRVDARRRASMQADEVLKVLDASSAVFGDWRHPKSDGPTRLVLMPLSLGRTE